MFLKFSSRENGKVIEEIKAFIPDLDYKELANERVIMDVHQFSKERNLQLQEHLKKTMYSLKWKSVRWIFWIVTACIIVVRYGAIDQCLIKVSVMRHCACICIEAYYQLI